MKKLLSIIMSTSIIICSLFCFNSTALAGGWVNSAQEVEFDTIYTEGTGGNTQPGRGKRERRRNTSFRCAEGNGCLGLCQNGDRKDDFGANFPNRLTISMDYAILTM